MRMLKCEKCNLMTDDEVGFCKSCANPLPYFNSAAVSSSPDIPSRRIYEYKTLIPLIAFFMLLFVGGLGLGIFLIVIDLSFIAIIPFVISAIGFVAGVLVPKAMIKDIKDAQKIIKEILAGKYSADVRLWNNKPTKKLTKREIYKNKKFDLIIRGGYDDLAHLASVIVDFQVTKERKEDEIEKMLQNLPAVFDVQFKNAKDIQGLKDHFNALDPKVEYEIIKKL